MMRVSHLPDEDPHAHSPPRARDRRSRAGPRRRSKLSVEDREDHSRHLARRLARRVRALDRAEDERVLGTGRDREPHRRERQHRRGNGLQVGARRLHRLRVRQRDLGDQPAPVRESSLPAARGFRGHHHDLDAADFPHGASIGPGDDLRGIRRLRQAESREALLRFRRQRLDPSHNMVHVPYKGMGQGSGALVAGDVQVAFTSYTAIASFAKAGKVRMLANADGRRTPALPDMPTLNELGLTGFDMASLLGALVPAGTPREIVAKLNAGIVAAINAPEIRDKMVGFGVGVRTSTPEEFDAAMRAEYEKYAKLVKLSGAKLD
ncbi:MAG: hypothetical protein E6H75_04650 [Betaproteobacteria bacterium]|nr:MAG: hypothetical protein E6H75_04650 [Betaproteobacteria bacterium]